MGEGGSADIAPRVLYISTISLSEFHDPQPRLHVTSQEPAQAEECVKRSAPACLKALFQNLPAGTEENHICGIFIITGVRDRRLEPRASRIIVSCMTA